MTVHLVRGRSSAEAPAGDAVAGAADVDKATRWCSLFSRRHDAGAGDADAASCCFRVMRPQQPPRDGEAPASQSRCSRIMRRGTAAAAAAPATGEQHPRDDPPARGRDGVQMATLPPRANPPSAANPPPARGRDGLQMTALRITGRDDGDGGRRVVLDDLSRGKGKEKEIVEEEDSWDYTDDTEDSITASSTTRPTSTSPPPPFAYRITPPAAASSSGSGRSMLPTVQEEEGNGQIVDVPALPHVPAPAQDGTDAPPPATTAAADAPAQASEAAATSCSGGPSVHD